MIDKEELELIVDIILLVLLIIFIIGIPVYFVEKASCARVWDEAYPSRYTLWEGCQIKIDGKWIPQESFILNKQQLEH